MKFIKKPIPVEAVKCIKENHDEIVKLLESGTTEYQIVVEHTEYFYIANPIGFKIHSWEGADPVYYDVTKNKYGNNKPYWIIKGIKGEVYPCVADDVEDAPLGYQRME